MSTRSRIEAAQRRGLRALLRRVLRSNRFYRRRIRSVRGRGLRETLAALPFTTKKDLVADQAARPPYGTNLTFPLDRYTRFHQTSATTGRPLRWLDTEADWDWMVSNWMRVYRAAGVGRGDRAFFAFSFGPFIGFWLAFPAAERLGCLCIPGGGLGSAARLRLILETDATVLCCTPTYALRLAEVAREERLPLKRSRIRTMILAGEPGAGVPAVRDRLTRAWNGARVFDHHGMTEVGAVTHECPDRPGSLEVMEHAYIAEILDPETGTEVDEGATGELVLTPLGRVGMPLVRYRTGDLVRKALHRGRLLLEGGILGRTDDMIIVRGVNLFPSAVDGVIRNFRDVAEYRVRVLRRRQMTELAVEIEPARGARNPAARVAAALRNAFSLRIPVKAVARGTLPRFEMKAKRWIRS